MRRRDSSSRYPYCKRALSTRADSACSDEENKTALFSLGAINISMCRVWRSATTMMLQPLCSYHGEGERDYSPWSHPKTTIDILKIELDYLIFTVRIDRLTGKAIRCQFGCLSVWLSISLITWFDDPVITLLRNRACPWIAQLIDIARVVLALQLTSCESHSVMS